MEEIRNLGDIKQAIVDRGKIDLTTETERQLEEKINTTYSAIAYEKPYTWSGVTKPIFLPKKYTTGTITVTQGSDIITGASTAWAENDHQFLKMQIPSSSVPFKIIRVASTTSITLEQAWVGDSASGVSYVLYQDDFGLFPDCQGLRRFTIPGFKSTLQPIPTSPTEMDDLRARYPFAGGSPRQYTVWGNSHYRSKTWATFNIDFDYWEDAFTTEARNLNMMVWPSIRTTDAYGQARYTQYVSPLNKDTDEPIIPITNRKVLVWGVLCEHFLQNKDLTTKREWEKMYSDEKMKMTSQIENYDDETILVYDNRPHRWTENWQSDEPIDER